MIFERVNITENSKLFSFGSCSSCIACSVKYKPINTNQIAKFIEIARCPESVQLHILLSVNAVFSRLFLNYVACFNSCTECACQRGVNVSFTQLWRMNVDLAGELIIYQCWEFHRKSRGTKKIIKLLNWRQPTTVDWEIVAYESNKLLWFY